VPIENAMLTKIKWFLNTQGATGVLAVIKLGLMKWASTPSQEENLYD
jgi:hypothetical protein